VASLAANTAELGCRTEIAVSVDARLHLIFVIDSTVLLLSGISLKCVGRFTLSLEVIRVVRLQDRLGRNKREMVVVRSAYQSLPALIGAARGVCIPHKVIAFLVVHNSATESASAGFSHAWRDYRNALERRMALKGIVNVLLGRGAEGLHVRLLDGGYRGVLFVHVATGKSGVIRSAMVVSSADGVEGVDEIRLRYLARAAQAIGGAVLALENLEGLVRHVAGEALAEIDDVVGAEAAASLGAWR
jgi:hypothetical protein